MSNRGGRGNPDAAKAAQNQQVIKSLLKLPANKHCADCKRNAHPRWASWNLGIFICIRCSGIHRGMGTHISRVKSVDLDAWTDEQLQSMLRWGNSRANKYWEANLAAGHVPSESKIENFIRTKYDSKRWVMAGGIPDPSTLNDSDEDETPLRVVQEKAKADAAAGVASPPRAKPQQKAQVNLFDDDLADISGGSKPVSPPPGAASVSKQAPPAAAAPPAQKPPQKPADSLLGLDFFGTPSQSPSPRPASAASNQSGGGSSRPDLNRSILSLYASAPKQTTMHQSTPSGTFSSFGASPPQSPPASQGLGGLDDAFSSLNFSSQPTQTTTAPPPQAQKQPSPFDSLNVGMLGKSSGGSMAPKPANLPSSGFFAPSKPTNQPKPAAASASSGLGDLFDFSSSAQPAAAAQNQPKPTSPAMGNFASKPQPTSSLSFDNAWSTPSSTTTTSAPKPAASSSNNNSSNFDAFGGGWNDPKPATATSPTRGDDEFGAFSMGGGATATSNNNNNTSTSSKPAVKYDDDLFQNVWG